MSVSKPGYQFTYLNDMKHPAAILYCLDTTAELFIYSFDPFETLDSSAIFTSGHQG